MKLASIATAAVIALTASPAFAAAENQDVKDVSRAVVLPVELKDPAMAYAIGLAPFYSGAAATYVGSSRLNWSPGEEYSTAAAYQTAGDFGLLLTSALLAGFSVGYSATTGTPTTNPMMVGGSLVSLALIPTLHAAIYAPYWGEQAVKFNKKHLAEAGFQSDYLEAEAATP